jgi:hypothetical protein
MTGSHYWSIGYDLKSTYQRNFTIGSVSVNGLLGVLILVCIFWPSDRADERGSGVGQSNPHLVTAWSKTGYVLQDNSIGYNECRLKIIRDQGSAKQNRPQLSIGFSSTIPDLDVDLLEEGFGSPVSGDGAGYGFGSGSDSGWDPSQGLPKLPSLIDLAGSLYVKISVPFDFDVVKSRTKKPKRKIHDPRNTKVLSYPVFPRNVPDSVVGKVVVKFIIVPRNPYWDGDSLKAYYLLHQSPEEYRDSFIASVVSCINQGSFQFRMARVNGIPTKVEDTVCFVITMVPYSAQGFGSSSYSDSLLLDSVLRLYGRNISNKVVP